MTTCSWPFTLRALIVVAVTSSTATTDSSMLTSASINGGIAAINGGRSKSPPSSNGCAPLRIEDLRTDVTARPFASKRHRDFAAFRGEESRAYSTRLRGGQEEESESEDAPWLNPNYTVPVTSQEWEQRVLEQAKKRQKNIIIRRREVDPQTGKTINITRREFTWEEQTDLMILHWLVVNAYRNAAERLYVEAKLDGSVPMDGREGKPLRVDLAGLLSQSRIDARREVKDALYRGDLHTARRLVDSAMGEIFWASHMELLFRLLLQHFIELVRTRDMEGALAFVRAELPPFIESNPGLLSELQRAMAVLTVDLHHPKGHPASHLLYAERRAQLFDEINAAMLRVLKIEPRTGPELLRTFTNWAEGELARNGWLGEGLPRDKFAMAMEDLYPPEEEQSEEEEEGREEEERMGRDLNLDDVLRGLHEEAAAELEQELKEEGVSLRLH